MCRGKEYHMARRGRVRFPTLGKGEREREKKNDERKIEKLL